MTTETKQIDEGGPAYPQPNHIVDHDAHGRVEARQWLQDSGMTRRQWLAGMALPAVIERYEVLTGTEQLPSPVIPEAAAEMAYRYADAMLAAEKGGAK